MPKVRTTLTLDDDILAEWQNLARIQRASLSSTINDWLADTFQAAEYKALQVYAQSENVRQRVNEITTALSVVEEGYAQVKTLGTGARPAGGRSKPVPPSCNTGGKLPTAKGAGRG